MRVVEWLHYDPDEYAEWEWDAAKDEPRWGYEHSGVLQYRLAEVRVNAEVDETTGEYTVLSFTLGKQTFIPALES